MSNFKEPEFYLKSCDHNLLHLTTNDSPDLREYNQKQSVVNRIKCNFCRKRLFGEGNLQRHLRTIHKKKK